MKPKYYWLYSDGKTVKEISLEQFHKISISDRKNTENSHLLAVVWDSEVYFAKGKPSITIRRKQLTQILGDEDAGEK